MMDEIEKIFKHVKCDSIILEVDIYTYMFCSPMINLYSSEVDSKPDIYGNKVFTYIQFSSVRSFLFFSFPVS